MRAYKFGERKHKETSEGDIVVWADLFKFFNFFFFLRTTADETKHTKGCPTRNNIKIFKVPERKCYTYYWHVFCYKLFHCEISEALNMAGALELQPHSVFSLRTKMLSKNI